MAKRRTSILDLFPVELLAMIKEAIPQGDIRTHVHFYMSFPPITPSLYGDEEEEEKFWDTACMQAGLGLLPGETLHPENVRWKKIAFDCIQYDGFCDHVECGRDLLDDNADYMNTQIDDNLRDISRALFFSLIPDEPDVHSKGTVISSTLGYIHFHDQKPRLNEFRPPEDDAFLFDPESSVQHPPHQLLRGHPVAFRSFASFPPTRRMMIGGTPHKDFIEVENVYGVTVWDVQSAIQMKLDDEVPLKQMQEILESNDYRAVFPPGCDFITMMRSLTTMRHFLSFYRIKDMEFVDWVQNTLYITCDYEPIRKANPKSKAMIY
ncbi:hypothetical protein EUX98_g3741 [Antrodiella citrinella]|uniref:Uncharacterized protein n=1 Tax=Antrodiella citrinella TaxID=2447956 RepID=A0A4S4MWV0_9APHY|nr:hypothetical protein EUX98_g3741 [Antrodiella citrinella]